MKKQPEHRQIKCPECGAEFEVETILRDTIEKELRQKLISETRDRLEADLKQDLQTQLSEQLANERKQLNAETAKLRAKLNQEAEQRIQELAEERERVKVLDQKLEEQRKERMELLKAKLERDELKSQLEEAVFQARQEAIAETKQTIRQQYQEEFSQQLQRVIADKDLVLAEAKEKEKQLKEQIEALKEKADQGSMQIQGEALETAIEELLYNLFPRDRIKEIETGAYGADLTQIVLNDLGAATGKIIYESKKAKHWQDKWIQKLRKDSISEKADLKIMIEGRLFSFLKEWRILKTVFLCTLKASPISSHN